MVRPVPGVEPAPLKVTTWRISGVIGEKTNEATVGNGMVVVVDVVVVDVDVDVVVSVILTMPGPTGFFDWQPARMAMATTGMASSSLRMTYSVRLRPTTGVTVARKPLFFMAMIAF